MTIKIKKSESKPESKEILAEAIVRIGQALKNLDKNGLNRHAIEVLIQYETKISFRDIKDVLNALGRLEGWYCRK